MIMLKHTLTHSIIYVIETAMNKQCNKSTLSVAHEVESQAASHFMPISRCCSEGESALCGFLLTTFAACIKFALDIAVIDRERFFGHSVFRSLGIR